MSTANSIDDPKSAKYYWETLQDIPNAPGPRSSHQLSSFGSNIYLWGGEDAPLNSHFGYGLPVTSTAVHSLDLDSIKKGWKELPVIKGTSPSPRLGHGQSIVVDEGDQPCLYIFGGRQPINGDLDNIQSLNDLYKFNMEAGAWEEIHGATGDVPSERSYHQMVSIGHLLFVFAGMINDTRYNDLYQFDTQQRHWTKLPSGPMEGRGGPGFCVMSGNASLIVVAGFCGRPMADVWEYRIASQEWIERTDWQLPTPRSIFACGTFGDDQICTFGGELENYDAALKKKGQDPTLQASLYTNETLLLQQESSAGNNIRIVDDLLEPPPVARGWTAGCNATMSGNSCFVVFGGVREGIKGDEPSGVRLGDLSILQLSS